ncbi:Hypothetical predicted protein [Marmota monax]|uniref:Uncharacterized protein n=1 Tax=Marmota monax TaxID=9995 RepID=A0A5E4D139_MARMO|nr:Hypothetical predicted protein [Marmota monax]
MLCSWYCRTRRQPYFRFTSFRQSQSLAIFFIDYFFHGSPSHFCIYCRRRATTGSSSYQKSRETLGFDSD